MKLNPNSVMAIAAIIQSIFLSFYFIHNKKGSKSGNRIFGMLLFVYALSTIYSLTRTTEVEHVLITERYLWIYIAAELTYLFGPLLYFYIRSIVVNDFKFKLYDLVHFLPFLVMLSIAFIKILILIYENRIWFPEFRMLDCSLMIFHLIVYGIVCTHLVNNTVKENILSLELSQIKWLKILTAASMILWVIKAVILASIAFWYFLPIFIYSHIAYFIVLFIFFYWLTFNALKYPDVLFFIKKYQKSELKREEIEEIKIKLVEFVENSKIYLDPSISISSLSKKISVPVPYLSRTVNECFNLNFSDFINRYRVEESKLFLKNQNENKKTVLDIAYSSGFNSKSSFYEAFKKHTGMTPSKFVRENPIA